MLANFKETETWWSSVTFKNHNASIWQSKKLNPNDLTKEYFKPLHSTTSPERKKFPAFLTLTIKVLNMCSSPNSQLRNDFLLCFSKKKGESGLIRRPIFVLIIAMWGTSPSFSKSELRSMSLTRKVSWRPFGGCVFALRAAATGAVANESWDWWEQSWCLEYSI